MKIRKILFLNEAVEDLNQGHQFYEQSEEGVGSYFLESVIADIDTLHSHAGIHQKQYGFFRMLSKRFPFAIYYSMDNSIVKIIAILDMRRSPVRLKAFLKTR